MQSHKKFNHRTMMGFLIINGKRYSVYEGINTIGRCMTATVPLKSLDISKQHAIITIVDNNEHYISDFQSFNGTFLEKSKLSPLLLYKISQDSVIEFANVTATYNQISAETIRNDNTLDGFHNTQTATQSLYEATTQAVEGETPYQNTTENIEQSNYFDDDYSFDDISTQLINENEKSPVFKIPLSVHEAPTQKFCDNDNVDVTEDATDIHNMETQKFEITSKIEVDNIPNINDVPTQILTLDKEQVDFDNTSIIDETVLDHSDLEVAEVTIKAKSDSQDSDSQSKLHVNKLHRRSTKPITDAEEDLFDNSEVIGDTQTDDEIICKPKRKVCVIESDTETDIEDLDENKKNSLENDSGSDTDVEDLEKNNGPSFILNNTVQKPVRISFINTTVSSTDSDTDIDDFEFNIQTNNIQPVNCNTDLEDYKINKSGDDCNDEVIPGTQFADEDVLGENLAADANELVGVLDNTKLNNEQVINSVDMDALYLEPTQTITPQNSHTFTAQLSPLQLVEDRKENDSAHLGQESLEIENESAILLEPTQPIVEHKNLSSPPEDDGIFVKPADPVSKGTSQLTELNANTIPHLESCVNEETPDDFGIYESQTQDILFLQPTQPISDLKNISSSTIMEDSIFEQQTQPITQIKSQLTESNTNDIFFQPTQALESASNKNDVSMQLTQLICESESQDALFLQPTQRITNTNDDILMQPTQELESNTEKDIFLEPTQPLTVKANNTVLKPAKSAIEDTQNKGRGETDDMQLASTQKLNVSQALVEDIKNKFGKMFASKNITNLPQNSEVESQLEVVFETQNVSYRPDVSYRPLNPLLNEFEGKRNEEFQNSEEPLLSSCIVEDDDVQNLSTAITVETSAGSSNSNVFEEVNIITQKVLEKTNELLDVGTSKNEKEDVNSSIGNKHRKSNLSLRKHKIIESDEDKDEYSFKPTVPLEELLPIPEKQENKQNVKNTKVIKKSSKAKVKSKKEDKKSLESIAPISEDIEKLETEEEITQSMRTTRSKVNSKPLKIKEPNLAQSKKKVMKNKNCTSSSDATDTSLLQNDVKTRPKRNAKRGKNVVTEEPNMCSTENASVNKETETGLDSIGDSRGKTRSAKTKTTKESDFNAKINLSNTVAQLITEYADKTNVSEQSGSNTGNVSDLNSTRSKKTRTKVAKDENTILASINLNAVERDAIDKPPQPSISFSEESNSNNITNNVSDTANTNHRVTVAKKKSKRIVSKSKKNNKDDSSVNNESSDVKDTFSVEVDQVPNISKTNETNKRKSTEDEINSLTNTNESSTSRKRARRVGFEETDIQTLTTSRTRKKRIVDSTTPTLQHISETYTMDSSPNRNRRKQKPKVVFTLLDSPELESIIRSLGGTVVNSVESCTVLVTGALKRTQKLLSAVGQGKPICSPKWLQECKKSSQFLDPWDHILQDKDAEDNWKLSLKESLNKSQNQKLFQNYIVYLTTTNSVDVLKAAVEACGGKCVTKAPSKVTNDNFIVVANPENKAKYSKFLNQDPPIKIVLPEAILDGVLRQELRFEEYLL